MDVPGGFGPDSRLEVFVLPGIGEIRAGDDLAAIILAAAGFAAPSAARTSVQSAARTSVRTAVPEPGPGSSPGRSSGGAPLLADGDILAVTSKIVSKAEGRQVAATDREQAITDETVRVVATRAHPGGVTRIVENRQGLVMAAAGVDASNVAEGTVLLLPADPDASARALCAALRDATGLRLGVLITDTVGRPWRDGQTDIAIGAAGVAVLDDLRGSLDAHGRRLDVTVAAVADEIAGAADLVKGKTSGNPVAIVRGFGHLVTPIDAGDRGARRLLRDSANDMFRVGSAEAYAEGYAAGLAAGAAPAPTPVPTPADLPQTAPSAPPKGHNAATRESPAADLPQTAPSALPKGRNPATRESPAADLPETAPTPTRTPTRTPEPAPAPTPADLPETAPSALPKGHNAATRESPAADLPESAPSAPPEGHNAATRESPAADVPQTAPSVLPKGRFAATHEMPAAGDGAFGEAPQSGATSGHSTGPHGASHGTAPA